MRAILSRWTTAMQAAGPETSRSGPRRKRRVLASAALVATFATCACTAVEDYSVRVAERSCATLSVCTVYGPGGEHLSPCISRPGQTIYPGDPRWPYTTPGVCDVVRDGRVVSSRGGG